jgi:HlyD family secretion protein
MQLIDSETYTAPADAKVREIYVNAGQKVTDGTRLMRLSTGDTIEAGFDGTVSAINVEKGDEVKAEASLITVADFDHMRVSVRVGESNISSVSVGQARKVTVSSAGASFDSTIGNINYVDYTGNNVAYYTTTVDVDTSETENIWPGMQATVTVTMDEAQDVTVLKVDALSTARDNTAYVYKENASGEMEEVKVTVGVSNGNYIEITDGLSDGDEVYVEVETTATSGAAGLLSGLFGGQQFNQPPTGPGGNMPGGGNMPNRGNFNGERGNWNGGERSSGSGGQRSSSGGGGN